MSFEVRIGKLDTNHTSNTREVMVHALGLPGGIRDLNGMPGHEAAGHLCEAMGRIVRRRYQWPSS